jgi:(1->4)-alpha-D-glucan 1-alpha-D-glucosylmutase
MAAPRATYRLQLHSGFGFDAAAEVTGYLAELGVSHAYLSPVLQAAPGSTHGYDVVDHSRPSRELGGWDGHARLVDALRGAGIGQVLDIVPNHMAIGGPENRWWWDVLENGPSSVWAGHFDVSWDPPEEKLRNTVLMPILGDHYGRVLERGEITLRRDGADVTVHYHEHELPVAPRSLAPLLAGAAADAGSDDLAFVATALRRLPHATRTDPASVAERHRDTVVLRRQLARLLRERPDVAAAVDRAIADTNADPDALDALLDAQNHRIAYWRTGGRELGYRRFFDIDTLVGLRVEDDQVFADTHELVLRWVGEGVVDGLRVDHPDGLRDPERYLRRLADATGDIWTVAEKVLEPGESLPAAWQVAGTTGYDRLAVVSGVFVDSAGAGELTRGYAELTGSSTDWEAVAHEAKSFAVRQLLASDVNRLSALLVEVCEGRRHQRDRTRHELHEALRELLVAFGVYRTYVRAEAGVVRADDVAHVEAAVRAVAERRPDIDPDLLGFLADLLLVRLDDPRPVEHELVMQFQQLTGPAMAKGVEDTAFYRFTRLLSLNEVGGDPDCVGVTVADLHGANAATHERWPATMTTLSTHDTKRSADVRARLHLLSEIPERWNRACRKWMAASAHHWPGGDPDRHTQHLLFQTLVGAWPLDGDRAVAYMAKATKEAKLRTTWTHPDADYDAARDSFVAAVLGDRALVAAIEAFVSPLVGPGRLNALAQTVVQLTAPGVPDIYQGTELWDLSLVDPDNRRPVDFGRRRALLAELGPPVDAPVSPGAGPAARPAASAGGLTPEALLDRADEGLPKLRIIRDALHLRRRRPASFGPGSAGRYEPLAVTGARAEHAVAFARGGAVSVVVPRLPLGLAVERPRAGVPGAGGPGEAGGLSVRGLWAGAAVGLPPGRWIDLVTGATWTGGAAAIPLDDLLARFPVALLELGVV